jgi:hypothetical protein
MKQSDCSTYNEAFAKQAIQHCLIIYKASSSAPQKTSKRQVSVHESASAKQDLVTLYTKELYLL